MPFKPADNPKCPKCGKSVYAAEEKVAGGYKYHKSCFKCGMCNKMLDSTNVTEHEAELYCKNCHGRKYGPKGYGFGGGAGCLSMDSGEQFKKKRPEIRGTTSVQTIPVFGDTLDGTWGWYGQNTNSDSDDDVVRSRAPLLAKAIAKAPEGEGCPRCGGYVYAAEQMLARGRGWHKICFRCNNCERWLDSTSHCDGPDGMVYCTGSTNDFYICFSMTDMEPRDAFHKTCFKCADCNKGLDSYNVAEGPDKDIYCKVCYGKRFGPKGYGYGQGGGTLQSDCFTVSDQAPKTTVIDTTSIKAKPGQGCPRCGGVVFAAEEVLAKGRPWHRKCFKCKDCTKTLDSINACDGPDRDVYCKTCYGKKWGPHGYGFACGSGFLQTDGLTEDEISASRPFYNPDTTSIKAPPGQGCPRCGGMVFAAEQQLAKGTMWHKKCFNCAECHRPLDSVLACDGPDKEIHCRACYAKLFGPKGFGFGHAPTLVCADVTAPTVLHDPRPNSGRKAAPGQGCKRCGYAVYAAEQMISKNGIWHRRCFSCADCSRSLDSTILNDGPNGDIYCRGCYGRNFGPKGVGFGMGAGTLTMA